MSFIIEAIVLGANADDMNELNRALTMADTKRGQSFGVLPYEAIQIAAGGNKLFCAHVWAAAFNYYGSDEELLEAAYAAWGGPLYGVAILANGEDEDDAWHMVLAPKIST